ncbi:MAG TPA: carboxypeptidase-like regulatory domain-containing protein, partial [Bacteroidota bacterium]|nr:carboxypeptidase-like regulatory domain-containing protein [Bacteroidota bacterium]
MTLRRLCTILSLIVLLAAMLFAAPPTGKITGKITDKTTHEPLIFANVLVVGTILGNSSDADGKFEIPGVPEGEYSIRVSYVGYKTRVDSSIRVSADQTTTLNIELEAEAVQNAPVIVTAQASGQNQAINQQLSTVGITNVVSSARIQELPDANAAESVGRLPGVSLLRSGGEGNEVVIRGLEPKYNVVTIDGVRMASSNANDRSADLSMISPYSLDGIEVIKVVTPDLDPDVLGGTVNFKMHEAKGEEPGLRFNLIGQQGYTGLSDAYEKFRNYKYVGSLEGRFFDDHSLGLFAQADIERRNLTSNEFGANYASASGSTTAYLTTGLNLNDVIRDRARDNATVVADYKLPNGKLVLSNFLSSGTTEDQNRGELYDLTNLVDNYTFGYTKSTLNQITNSLETDYNLPIFHADIKFSHSYSETNDPNDWTIGFHNSDPHLGPFQPEANLDPHAIPPAALVDSAANLNSVVLSNSFARERALTASLDLDTRLDLTDWNASAVFKFGGKFRHQTRSNEQQQSGGDGPAILSATYFDGLITNHFGLPSQYAQNTNIPISPFLDPNFSYGDFLGGDYQMVLPMNYDYMSQMANLISTNAANISRNDSITWNWNKFNGISFNYDGYENQTGAYGMTTIDLGTAVTLIPGIRYQDEYTSYTAPQGIEDANSQHGGPYRHYDTTVVVDNSYWLPD